MKKFLITMFKFYQMCISPCTKVHCRFTPNCSSYAIGAVQKYGCKKGILLTTKRILKCNPFFKGGYDPVP